jgi:MOSC domain-containing protein YiiM
VPRSREAGRIGCYLRVVKTGSISAGDHIHRIFVPKHGITVGKWFSDPTVEDVQTLLDAEADGEIRLQPEYHDEFEQVMRRAGANGWSGAS